MLFDPIDIAGIKIKNRFVRSATHEGLSSHEGCPTKALNRLYEDLAFNNVGLIITGYAYINPNGKSDKKQQGIYDDLLIEKYIPIIQKVHSYGSKIVMQIVHGGRQSMGDCLIAPSVVKDTKTQKIPQEMSESEILQTIEDFAQAARRVKEAGFDGVQLHCAHGFLLSSFLSPYTNRRSDRWGGSIQNRTLIVLNIIKRIRELLGAYPIFVKLNMTDGIINTNVPTLDAHESIEIAKILANYGVCAIEVSGGIVEAEGPLFLKNIDRPEKEAYYKKYAKMIKNQIDIPVILVGGIRSSAIMKSLLENQEADMIALCRPLIAEPDLITKIEKHETTVAKCISCNNCLGENGIKCSIFN